MKTRWFGAAAGFVAMLTALLPVQAQDAAADKLKTRLSAWLDSIGAGSKGALHWAGSDPIAVRRDGDALVADIDHGRIASAAGDVTLGRFSVRETGTNPDTQMAALSIALPKSAVFREGDGRETRLSLDDGTADIVLDKDLRHLQAEQVGFTHARVEQPKTGAVLAAGPLSLNWKLNAAADGSWKAPIDFDLKAVTFEMPQTGSGSIDHLSYRGAAAGPKLAEFEKLRDTVASLQTGDDKAREAGMTALLALLPSLPSTFSTIAGDGAVEGVKVEDVKGGALAALAKFGVKSEVTGLDGGTAAVRITIRYDGLKLAPSLVPENAQPHRLVVDIGLTDIDSAALRDLLQAAAKAAPVGTPPPAPDPMATAQLLGAATRLTPSLHAYDVAIDTDDVGLDFTGATKGSPMSPQGYQAAGDLGVRGLDALPKLGLPALADMLPLLRELGKPDPATGRVLFHLASTTQKRITINGNDVGAWFSNDPQILKPAWPPTQGDEVKGVQRALSLPESGVYDGTTAAAVARFQQAHGLDRNGVVDAATRAKLGLPPASPR